MEQLGQLEQLAGARERQCGRVLGQSGADEQQRHRSLQVAGLIFDGTAGAFNLSGNSMQLSGAVINNSTATQTISMNIGLFGGNGAFNTAAGKRGRERRHQRRRRLAGIAKSGSGTLALTASNSYSGGTYLTAGVLQAANNNSLGCGRFTLNGGALTSTGTAGLALRQ